MPVRLSSHWLAALVLSASAMAATGQEESKSASPRERFSIYDGWRFYKYEDRESADGLVYDTRPRVTDRRDNRPADTEPTEAVEAPSGSGVLKPWVLPTANPFIRDPAQRHARPEGSPGSDFPYVQAGFDDSDWQAVDLPHDWAIGGPFFEGWNSEVGGGMGRLPSPGVAWYRRKLDIPVSDAGRSVFLDVDGAMSYAMVWCNGSLVGGWPFGYSSWRVDLTPYLDPGGVNQLAIRLDNPPDSSRWYPGGGLYRNVWLVKTAPMHVAQWGVFVTTPQVSQESAAVNLAVTVENYSDVAAAMDVRTSIYETDSNGRRQGPPVAESAPARVTAPAGGRASATGVATLRSPKLWGPPPTQTPNLYVALTRLRSEGRVVDVHETRFGVRSIRFDPDDGLHVNGQRIRIQGANQHHDLGPLGAAFNLRAAERQLVKLREMGCNAIRMAHNSPAPELLDLTDRMGFLVVDESFDVWERKKTPLDFHLIFPDWHEADMRALVRRDRNHPSVIAWSIGNEVGEQYTGDEGAAVARRLHEITKQEDPTRPTTTAMNFAKPPMPLPGVTDLISLNYQGEGIRNAPAYAGLRGINTPPLYPAFRRAHPEKPILSSENAAALSTRGAYLFPVFDGVSAPVKDGAGGDPMQRQVSAYELYTAEFGSSADKVFASLDDHPYVAGGFVWSGWDYLGEPTPYYLSRSSYFGVIDLAGFEKDRYYLYQSRWRPDLPMAHLLPHWTWPERVGEVTPVHLFTTGDEAELFLNGESLGRKRKGARDHRLRWDEVVYEPGELKAIAYKDGTPWAEAVTRTAGEPHGIEVASDRTTISADGHDLAFIAVRVVDKQGRAAPRADDFIEFSLDGPGEIVATANGDPTGTTPFPAHNRRAFHGRCLAIVRAAPGGGGLLELSVTSDKLRPATIQISATPPVGL